MRSSPVVRELVYSAFDDAVGAVGGSELEKVGQFELMSSEGDSSGHENVYQFLTV